MSEQDFTFWDHLNELRKHLLRIICVYFITFIILFNFKEFLFDKVLLSLLNSDFVSYRIFSQISAFFAGSGEIAPPQIEFHLINTQLSGQFMSHISITAIVSIVLVFPYIIFQLWHFIVPALYESEKKVIKKNTFIVVFLFIMGAAFAYYVVTPLSVMFLGNYQVSESVTNSITITSYLSIFSTTIIMMGILFELPVILGILTKTGILNTEKLKKYRKFALVAGLVLSAIITPTGDPFTMIVVALPIYLLYEVSIAFTRKKSISKEN